MATMALPLNSLIVEAERAQAETTSLASASGAETANLTTVLQVFKKTFALKYALARMATRQGRAIARLQDCAFSEWQREAILDIVSQIDGLVKDEREMLACANTLSVVIRFWWEPSLSKLSDQIDHLDSMSESLHVASDSQATALMAMALDRFAMDDQFALR